MSDARLLIGGERAAGMGAALEVENPYTERSIQSIGSASEEQVDAALAAAREAADGWALTPAVDRAEMLHEVASRRSTRWPPGAARGGLPARHEVASRLRDRTGAIARTTTIEGGKPMWENRDEVGWTAAAFD